jgi:hypothetical protein
MSNVEQNRPGRTGALLRTSAVDPRSTFIRAPFNNDVGNRFQLAGFAIRSQTLLEPMADFVAAFNEGADHRYGDVMITLRIGWWVGKWVSWRICSRIGDLQSRIHQFTNLPIYHSHVLVWNDFRHSLGSERAAMTVRRC